MFPGVADPTGRYLLLNNVTYQVAGAMTPKGASPGGNDQDDVVMVPLTTGGLRLLGNRNLRTITVAARDAAQIGRTEEEVRLLLIDRHGSEDFQIRNMATIIDTAMQAQDTLTILLGSVA